MGFASTHGEVLVEEVGFLLFEALGEEAAGDGTLAAIGGEEDPEVGFLEVEGPCDLFGTGAGGGVEEEAGEEVAEDGPEGGGLMDAKLLEVLMKLVKEGGEVRAGEEDIAMANEGAADRANGGRRRGHEAGQSV